METKKNKLGILSLIPGLGHAKLKHKTKAILYGTSFFSLLVISVLNAIYTYPRFFNETIGFEAGMGNDNSFYIMVRAVMGFYMLIILIALAFFAYRDCKKIVNNPEYEVKPFKAEIKEMFEHGFMAVCLVPAGLLLTFFVLVPITITIVISFTNYAFMTSPPNNLVSWVGFENYTSFFQPAQEDMISYRDVFWPVLRWTFVWTIVATSVTIVLGTITGFVFNQEDLKFKKILTPLFLLPWAVPAFITITMFSQMFADTSGVINTTILPFLNQVIWIPGPADLYSILESIGAACLEGEQAANFAITVNSYGVMEVPWKTNEYLCKLAILMIQPLLGFPYVFTVVLSNLKSIPSSLYNAAEIDGANVYQKFRFITLPLLVIAILPVLITQFTFNFNNFGMIYLFNGGGPGSIGLNAGSTDILISWVFKMTTGSTPDYGMAAAVSILMSFITIGFTLIVFLKSNAFKKEDMR